MDLNSVDYFLTKREIFPETFVFSLKSLFLAGPLYSELSRFYCNQLSDGDWGDYVMPCGSVTHLCRQDKVLNCYE